MEDKFLYCIVLYVYQWQLDDGTNNLLDCAVYLQERRALAVPLFWMDLLHI
jgi:hypothetical protein